MNKKGVLCMGNQYNSMSVAVLREIAKERGLRVSGMKKQELIDALIQMEIEDNRTETEALKKQHKPAEEAKQNEIEEKKPAAKKLPKENQAQEKPVRIASKQETGKAETTVHKVTAVGNSKEEERFPKKTAQVGTHQEKETTASEEFRKTTRQKPLNYEKEETGTSELNRTEPSRSEYRQEANRTEGMRPESRGEANRMEPGRSELRGEANRYENRNEESRSEYHNEGNRTDPRNETGRYQREEGIQERVSERRNDYNRTPGGTYRRPENSQPGQNSTVLRPGPVPVRRVETRISEGNSNDFSRYILIPNQPLPPDMEQLDSGETKEGILEVMTDGYGFIRCDNFLPGDNDVYVAPAQIRKMNLKTGDIIVGNTRVRNQNEKFSALLYIRSINGMNPMEVLKRPKFEDLTPIFPNERIHLETPGCSPAMRMVDLISPIGKGQRGMIVSQPKAGKTTLLKQVAGAITKNYPEMHLLILLIDERPEEVTDMKESIEGKNVEVIYSTFDELPENHKRVSEMVIERAKRLVEHKKDVVILLDSITRLARAYNLTVQASGRTLSGGLDPAALHMPKKFFGAARNMREGGSLTILATALVETGSRMDDVVFEEFKGTGNMELVLDRSLSEKRIFPAIDLPKSSTRRDDLLLDSQEAEANYLMRKAFNSMKSEDAVERIIQLFVQTKSNQEFIQMVKKNFSR